MKPMPIPVRIPVVSQPLLTLGPGSQPEEDALQYLPMPSGMRTYHAPELPEAEAAVGLEGARRLLRAMLAALDGRRPEDPPTSLDVWDLAPADLKLLDQVLGEGEVSAVVQAPGGQVRIQESVFAGVWRLRRYDADDRLLADWLEVADVPETICQQTGRPMAPPPPPGPGLASAPALLAEIAERAGRPEPHVINLSLLPFGPADGHYLDAALGRGAVSILSRGYGNCRITATAVDRVWWVQYFNSQDALILNTLEIADVPEVARAAREDLEDSRERFAEVLEWIG